jgi:type IV pilus assembly protein PilC
MFHADYRYEIQNAAGKVTTGTSSPPPSRPPAQQLRAAATSSSLWPPPTDRGAKKPWNFSISFGPSAKDVQNFTSQLAVMIRAGISIRAAIEGIADQDREPQVQEDAQQMKKDVEAASSSPTP